jgi:hypothetical protein
MEAMTMGKVHAAINKVKLELAAHGGITKDRTAPDQIGGYAFRGIDDADNVLCGLTAKHGLVLYPRVVDKKSESQIDGRGKLQRHIELTMEIDIVHEEDGSMHTVRACGEGIDSGDKGTGKAHSNARKQAVFSVFQVPTHGENVEEYAAQVAPAATPQAATPPQQQPAEPPPAKRQRTTKAENPAKNPPMNTTVEPPFPHGAGGDPHATVESLMGAIGNSNTFPLLYAVAQDADKVQDPNGKQELFTAVQARAVYLFSSAQSMAEVKEGFPLVTALGQPADVAKAANEAYARFRQPQGQQS